MRDEFLKYKRRFTKTHAAKIAALKRLHEHPVMYPVAVFLVLSVIAATAFLFVNGGRPQFKPIISYIVIINHDHQQQIVPTRQPTVAALLAKLNLKLNTG